LNPVELTYKEGLALINGTTLMAALGVVAYTKAKAIYDLATTCTALLCEAICARKEAFNERIHLVRRHKHQIKTAAKISNPARNSAP
ncbi:MAG: histidine ammonia-lyase, partial [Bacteroidota bacterium]